MTSIYTLSDPDTGEVRYVGQTSVGLDRRLYIHWHNRSNTHTSHWVHSLKQPPIIEEIDSGDETEWSKLERYWIWWHRVNGYNLTNHSDGGEGGNFGIAKSDSWKAKIGLANQGEQNGQAKLTVVEVRQIKQLLREGVLLQREIAERFGVSRRTVGFIGRRERWASVDARDDYESKTNPERVRDSDLFLGI
jgi:GIY-YIG catalytic domain